MDEPTGIPAPRSRSTTSHGVRALATSTSPSSAMPAALRAGVLAAIGTWSVVVLPALVGWVASSESSLGWFSAVSVGTAIWFLGHGQSVGIGSLSISLTPLLLLLVFVYIAYRWARRLAATQRLRVGADRWSRVAGRELLPGFIIGYGLVAAVVALFTLGGPATPGVAAVLGALVVPVMALGFVLVRPESDTAPAFVKRWFRRGPTWLPSVWRIGWRGAVLLLALGFAVALARIALSWGSVSAVQEQYSGNLAESAILAAGQVALLGNAATWALSFLAGPGFQIAVGSTISPAAAHPGLLPLIPVFGALPESDAYPSLMYAVALAPVAVGAYLGRRVDAELEFFGNVRARVSATVVAAALAVTVVIALTALGNGAVGTDRLSAVGPRIWPLAAALALEVVGGALLWLAGLLLADLVRSRRERSAEADQRDGLKPVKPGPLDGDDGAATGSGDDPDRLPVT
ncbi:cell division protein PerM [Intrasporangium mesophilum]